MKTRYNESPYTYKRRITREVKVGDVGIGGKNPIRIQSMTNADTKNVEATIRQIRELQEVGSELVRITVPTSADAEALPIIRKRMKEENLTVPLVADIHFTPSIAMKAVEYVEKVRINPGNFADRKKFAVLEYTDQEYKLELERLFDAFSPLVLRAKELGVAMRIGTNHGSLSDRIMNRFGDSPKGMVESAIEFIKVAEAHSYRDIIVSMKASNTQVMVHAYRLLVSRFYDLDMHYPLHLGVTEAGDGKDGRVKSCIGIGSLLDDGLGDTIRVSLTEDPIVEIPVAKRIVAKYNEANFQRLDDSIHYREFRNPFAYTRFFAREIPLKNNKYLYALGDSNPIRVEANFQNFPENFINEVGNLIQACTQASVLPESLHFRVSTEEELSYLAEAKRHALIDIPISFILQGSLSNQFYDNMHAIHALDKWVTYLPYFTGEEDREAFFGTLSDFHKNGGCIEWILRPSDLNRLDDHLEILNNWNLKNSLFSVESDDVIRDYRRLAFILSNCDYPIVFSGSFSDEEEALYNASIGFGGLLLDGLGDMIRISFPGDILNQLSLSYDILQGARLRLSKTEYISCPSCGRTQFDLQDTTARIKKRTIHLKGVKIAVMGCIVNGPGEMADADFGYVGAAPGKVHLYRGKEIVMKNVPEEIADEKLVELIKENGMWKDA
ncbi:MAG: (E)-4-hydroxy-3-methylbut-2-enyl-diphosphate synthase [Leptospira sp.]|nr:(E)-4-hydroxy-3-methylbut-2-enyl-diphosphate synthase [Leptospira sp.]